MRNRKGYAATVVAFLVASAMMGAAPAGAESADIQARSNSLGQIPPGGGCANPLNVLFDVDVSGPLTDVGVTFQLSPAHTWAGDAHVALVAPGGAAAHAILVGPPTFESESSDLVGPYRFSDNAPGTPTFWQAATGVNDTTAVPAGSYRSSNEAGENTLITPSFAGIADPDGTWRLVFCDFITQDTGSVSAATLHLSTGGSPPPGGSSSSSQSVTLGVVQDGVLAIAASQPSVDWGTVDAGESAPASIGTLTYENTLGSEQPWSATVAATSLVGTGGAIPFTNISFAPGSSTSPDPDNSITEGGASSFSGSDPTPGTSYSDPVSLITASSSDQGTFSQSGSTATLTVPSGTAADDYAGTLQYTVTG